MNKKTGQTTLLSNNPYIELSNQGQIITFQLTQDNHILGRDRLHADLVVPSGWLVISSYHATIRKIDDRYYIYDGDGHRASTNGLFLDRTRITPSEGHLLENGMEIKIGLDPQNQILLKYFDPNNPITIASLPKTRSISLKDRSVLLGRDPDATLELDAPIVSRSHATIEPNGQGNYVLHDYSTNGVFVNGVRVKNSIVLTEGAVVKIGPFTLIRRGDRLEVFDPGNQIRIDADRLFRIVRDQRGKTRVLLNDISFAIEPGQFVALVGGSGTGKSTLMRTLLGIDPTTKGKVYINGEDLRNNFNIYRTQIGYVPQDDIIHRELTVLEVLNYAAKLRLPPDINIKEVVEKTLEQIEMKERKNVLVSQLSGGQRKRVSIGVELLADPKLFFLDEPTSGLDPGLDKKMMQLLRKLANQGRTIILVTHATANIRICDRVVFLGRGGRLCYFGSSREAMTFFSVNTGDFADIYNELETSDENINEWVNNFRQSEYYRRYIANHLSIDNLKSPTNLPPKQQPTSFWKQLFILIQRYFQLTIRDPINLGLALFTAPIGISLILFAVRDKNPLIGDPEPTLAPLALRVLFVFTCACLWVSLSSSLQEIVKESAIYIRERLVNLGLFAYLSSKLIVLGLLATLQTLLIVVVVILGFENPQPELISWPIGVSITTFLTLISCISLGLMISSIVKNGSQANSALPLILLPQIIFSGVLFEMTGIASKFSWLMLSRWSVAAYGALVNVNNMVPEATKLPNGSTVPLPFSGSDVYNLNWENLGISWGALCLHSLIYLGFTIWFQKRKDIV
ncbi:MULTISPECIES: ATP-binding cassette domain-containing protein [Okeania]|uniref:ATP-binding cassette domain-containing protein n=1 Tax=Okeania hirsuta TaxID=1458930 RepID=A0A3N6Q454_9CYAN|nr:MULTISPECIES: ATP-binding cassette domain-containing protein [Okeania]NES76523.1 ATP-binding cassette domain-containing protein [Okeania sp. SIO1H4]NET20389.1 ATP-binding cassette domain-containing protein [Okeania sp. SIO1H5]NET77021.1 ATP-binding cassette domain-containing protein [Okeania sp. SIO1F9]NET94655.1 ATP-binding cassette domain-containing protein [Okeania sp. SIO1H2]RQH24844.1 ATP-binding cassette domain-containing protein [Okeania hirsuta]